MACGDPAVSSADCEASDCCFDPRARQRCYYSSDVTVQCTTDGQFVVVVPRDVTTPPLSLDTVSLLGGQSAPCSPVGTTAGFAKFQFPVSACGSILKAEGGDLLYENMMSSAFDVQKGPDGSITRDSLYELTFLCRYSGSELLPVEAVVYTAAPPPPSVVAPGPLSVELRIATEAVYDSYYRDVDYPVTKVLRDPVYVEVRILNRTDPNIVLTLEDCWATSTPSPLDQPQWSLLVNGLHNVSSDGLKPTWVPFTETQSAEDFLDFSLQLMTDDWSSQRPSNVFYLGDVLNLQAEVRVAGHVPLRLFADGCVATLASDPTSEPRYSFVENYGCLTDAKVTGSSSWFRPRPLDFTKLQMQLDAFRFHQDSRSLIYITCHLKVILASQNVDSVNKACYFEGGRWRSADGSDLVCGCCDSSCGPDSKSKRQRRIKSRRAVPSNAGVWVGRAFCILLEGGLDTFPARSPSSFSHPLLCLNCVVSSPSSIVGS
ncbi:ZP1 protein, partial [Amia calva]|nr:ZP1 protein [Amia calva]